MSIFETSAPFAVKTSSPDWMDVECECLLEWCPQCDPDSFHDQMRDDFSDWDSFEEVETPFQGFDIPPLRGHVPQDLVNVNLRHIKNQPQIAPKMSDLYAML